MGRSYEVIDQFAVGLARLVMRYRWFVVVAAFGIAIAIGSGGRHLEFANNYRVFFSDNNPELAAFEKLQATYTKNDNFLFVLRPAAGGDITQDTILAVEQLTEAAWQIPYASRVDSLTNFQHTYGIDDDLIVEDLMGDPASMDPEEFERRIQVALDEPLLIEQIIASNRSATAVNVVLQYPQQDLTEVPSAVAKAREIRETIKTDFPELEVYVTGVSMLNNAFSEIGTQDLSTLIPLMFAIILFLVLVIIRSIAGTLTTLFIIMLSTMVGMGTAGYYGIDLTPIAGMAPIVIMTLAIADSIHILITLRTSMRQGMDKEAVLRNQ